MRGWAMLCVVRSGLVHLLLAACLSVFLAACGGSNSTPPPPPPPTVAEHLYVAVNIIVNPVSPISGAPQSTPPPPSLLQFTLPITSSSTPSLTLSANNLGTLAIDNNGNLASCGGSGVVTIFNAPLNASSTASATFQNGNAGCGTPVFNTTGDLFVPDGAQEVFLFRRPFTSNSSPSQMLTDNNLFGPLGTAVDANSNFIVTNCCQLCTLSGCVGPCGHPCSYFLVFSPPFASAQFMTATLGGAYSAVAINGTQLFVAETVGPSHIDVYNLPLSAGSQPAFSFGFQQFVSPGGIAFDHSGNLYVVDSNALLVFNPPFSNSSTGNMVLIFPPPPGNFFSVLTGVAIGK